MTMLLVLEDVQAGRTTLDTRVTVTKAAAGVGGSQVWLAPGESFPVSELLYALMLTGLFRILVLCFQGEVWAAWLTLGGIFIWAGAFCWKQRTP